LKEVYQYFVVNLDLLLQNEELAQTTLFALRDERLFLNIDDEEDQLNWVQGSSLAFDCNVREGSIQEVRKFLRPFETILVAAGALKVKHPSYNPEHGSTQQSESVKLQNIWSSFDQLRKERAFIDVEFIAHADDVPIRNHCLRIGFFWPPLANTSKIISVEISRVREFMPRWSSHSQGRIFMAMCSVFLRWVSIFSF
jgi:hypothetical protein